MNSPIEDGPLPGCPLSSPHGPHGSCEGDPKTYDASTYGRESITLTTHTLGLDPYVLIRAVKIDPDDAGDDGLRLKIEHGGGAEGPDLAALYVLNLPAEENPLTAAIAAVIRGNPDHPCVTEVLRLFAEFCDLPMPS